jgi:hypothetical protein
MTHSSIDDRAGTLGFGRMDGTVLVVTLLVMLLMSAIGAALVLATSSESLIAANFRLSREAIYAADAAAERAAADFSAEVDVDAVLDGRVRSTFADGPPSGVRAGQGVTLDLTETVYLARCHKKMPCTDAEMDAVTTARPWGPNNPRWQLYTYGWLKDIAPTIVSPYYVVVMVGDDSAENDNDPLRDATVEADESIQGRSGIGAVTMRAEAFGPRHTHKVIELTVRQTVNHKVRTISWREIK